MITPNSAANMQTSTPPIAEGTNPLSAGQASRLHPVSASFRNEADHKMLHIRRDGRIVDHSEQGCQRADRHPTNRRRHKPALTRAGVPPAPGVRFVP